MSAVLSAPAFTTSRMLAWVITSVGSRTACRSRPGTTGSSKPLSAMPDAAGVLPAISAAASWAVVVASSLMSLKTVTLCWPLTMFCRPSVPASCPVTTT
jgi:hypothetical protein